VCNSTSIGKIIKIGLSMTIECAEGNELVREKMAYIVNRPIILHGLGALGNVRVLARMSFPAPPTRKAVSYRLTGAFKSITLDLPAGAWPSSLLVGPSIAISKVSRCLLLSGEEQP